MWKRRVKKVAWNSTFKKLRSWHLVGLIMSWQIEGEKVEAMTDFIFLGSKITADSDCSHEIERRLLLQRKVTTNLSSATAKSLQSCLTLCDPIDGSPTGSPIPGILQARTLEWVAIFFSNAGKWKVKVKSLSRVRLFENQAPPSMGFSRQEYWSGCHHLLLLLLLNWTSVQFSSISQLCLTLQPHGLQHARLSCPSLTPGACSNSCPSSQWCHPATSSSVVPFSSCLQPFPASGSFPRSHFFASGGQSIEASASVLPMNIRTDFL